MALSDLRLPVGCREHITQVDATMSSTQLKLNELAKLHDPLRIKVTDSGGKPMGGKWVFAMLREMAGYVIGDYQVRQILAGVLPKRSDTLCCVCDSPSCSDARATSSGS